MVVIAPSSIEVALLNEIYRSILWHYSLRLRLVTCSNMWSFSGYFWFTRSHTVHLITIILLCPLALARYPNIPNDLLPLSKQFETAPSEGIILLSEELSDIDLFLNDGETDEVTYNFVFTPPSGTSPSEYSLSFSCDDDLIYSSGSCSLSSVVATITTSSDTVYNTTVSCVFNRFPGTTGCNLVATLDTNVEEFSTRLNELSTSSSPATSTKTFLVPAYPISNISDANIRDSNIALNGTSVRQTTTYTSDTVTCNIYGVVFYLLDSFGERGSSSTIVSGLTNSYTLASYDETDGGVREVQVYSSVPGGASISGSSALAFFSAATVSLDISDYIFFYDASSCSITDASISSGEVTLPSSDTCGLGVAVENEDSDPVLGVQFRTYKSGNLSVSLTWPTLGTSLESYEQTIIFEILEAAPPIVTDISKSSIYRSTPCESETITLSAYNVRYANVRELIVTNNDGSTSTWSEVTESFSYNSATDTSTVVFESAGGSGTDVPFILNCTFDSDVREGIVFDSYPVLTLSFSSPPSLSSMDPTTSSEDGGDVILLIGSFEGFGDDDIVYVGGYEILGSSVTITGTTQISFLSPALSDVGEQYSYDVVVAICAEKSDGIALVYSAPPNVTISSSNSSPNDDGAFIIPSGGSTTFLAIVTGNNEGLFYAWQIFQSDGSQISTSGTNDEDVFVVTEDMLSSTDETYVLRVEVVNSLNLADFDEVNIQLTTTEYISANVYETNDVLYRSTDVTTLVQAEVTSSSDSDVSLEWSYSGESYSVDSDSVFAQQLTNDSSTTGPSKLGLEFNIARRDLQVGSTVLTLTAYLNSNPSVRDSDSVTIRVAQSRLRAVINDGINGTLIAAGSDIRLSATNSRDPDILDGEEDNVGIVYQWGPCLKSSDSTFREGSEDCSSVFPSVVTSTIITIPGAALVNELLGVNSTILNPTFFLFRLKASKGDRVAYSYLYFEVRSIADEERIPSLLSLNVVDIRGDVLDTADVDLYADTIIQPFATESIVEWHFDMLERRHRYLFAVSGKLKVGAGFVTRRNEKSRLLLGFAAGSLEPATEYTVVVTAVAQDTSIETEYQVSFRTAEVPKLTCNLPQVQTGIVSSTLFTVKALLSFQSQKIDYCFYLVSQSNEKFPVGKGCSFISFASFTFPREGVFSIECVAKASSGSEIDKVTLVDAIELFPPPISVELSQVEYLSQRLSNFTAELDRCEAQRDHTCVRTLIMSANDFSLRVERAVASDSSQEAADLLERCKEYIAELTVLSDSLASRTVLRPNEVEQSIDQSLYLAHVPNTMITDEEILYLTLSQVNEVVESVSLGETDAVRSNYIVDKVTSISNMTLSKAFNIDQGGTTRTRLRARQGAPVSLYASVLFPLIRNIWSIRFPQEVCGYRGFQLTEYPSSLKGVLDGSDNEVLTNLPAVKLFTGIACDKNQLSGSFGSDFEVKVCQDVIDDRVRPRIEVVVAGVPEEIVAATQMATDITPYMQEYVYVTLNEPSSLPNGCLELIMKRKRSSLSTTVYDNLTAGVLTNLTVSSSSRCTRDTCYKLVLDDNRTATFTSQQIIVTTRRQGLHVAGNLTTRAPVWYNDNIEGVTGSTAVATGFAIFGMFVVVAGLVTWIAATTCVVVLPGVDEVGWEYVERDMFGRGSVEALAFGPTSMSSTGDITTVGSTFTALARQKSTEAYERKSTNMIFG